MDEAPPLVVPFLLLLFSLLFFFFPPLSAGVARGHRSWNSPWNRLETERWRRQKEKAVSGALGNESFPTHCTPRLLQTTSPIPCTVIPIERGGREAGPESQNASRILPVKCFLQESRENSRGRVDKELGWIRSVCGWKWLIFVSCRWGMKLKGNSRATIVEQEWIDDWLEMCVCKIFPAIGVNFLN